MEKTLVLGDGMDANVNQGKLEFTYHKSVLKQNEWCRVFLTMGSVEELNFKLIFNLIFEETSPNKDKFSDNKECWHSSSPWYLFNV